MDKSATSNSTGPETGEPGYGVEAHVSLAALPPKVLKHGDVFAVLDMEGDCGKSASTAEGIYFHDMRHLSRWQLTINRRRPLLLASSLDDDNAKLTVSLTNPDIEDEAEPFRKDTISIVRNTFLWAGACFERIEVRNFDLEARRFSLEIAFGADFMDLFEVRGLERAGRGRATARADMSGARFDYEGLDGIGRATTVRFDPAPASLTEERATFSIRLAPGERATIIASLQFCEAQDEPLPPPPHFLSAYRLKRREAKDLAAEAVKIESSNGLFNELIHRSSSDIYMLLSKNADGVYPHAGIPWYSTVFGRDGLIAALFMLWADPSIARGVLLYLAARQACDFDPTRDAQPGKILHEERQCETARTGEVPFASYYGTVDATPLFVLLAGRYLARTGDLATIRRIWPNVVRALAWCETFGDPDGDGFVEYIRETPNGLANQGWKDSFDSIFHRDGALAQGPIALVEVQAYVYEARLQAAMIADRLGENERAAEWRAKAAALKDKFNAAFWCPELGTFALALDGDKAPCQVKASNPGHVLMTGLASPDHARQVGEAMLSSELFCGWGVRTLAADAARYNPMSYHNGSVWPHDNAMIGIGLARWGFKPALGKIFEGLYSAQSYQTDRRLPELFCGFPRKPRRGPISYPVSCSPQAWASAAMFALIGASLGLSIDCEQQHIEIENPLLPRFADDITLRGIRLGEKSADIRFLRRGDSTFVDVLRTSGNVTVVLRE